MFSVQKLLGRENQLFTLLEASAKEARASVQAVASVAMNLAGSPEREEAGYPRHKARQITDQITVAVYTTYITAIGREDIQALAQALYKISKAADKFMERVLIAPRYAQGVDFSKQIALLVGAADTVVELVKLLRQGMNPGRTKELIERLQSFENQADALMPAVYQDLFSGRHDAVKAIFLKDLHERLEKAIDHCRSAGNVISRVTLKNS